MGPLAHRWPHTTDQDVPYPDTRDLIAALREQTPAKYQYLIDDGFDRIVLYDDKAVSATARKRPDGKYEVTPEAQVRKTPTLAGLDPWNKLIDLIPEDNLVDVAMK